MWGGGFGDLGLTLQIDSPIQRVGAPPTYRITGGTPGETIYWSSYKNGQPTGEDNASYGQSVGPNGTAELVGSGSGWQTSEVGDWIKEIRIKKPDGTWAQAMVSFRVLPPVSDVANVVPTVTTDSISLFGVTLPKPVVWAGAGLLAFMLLGGGGRRR